MAVVSSPWFWTAVALSLLAPITYLVLLRRVEKHGRESWMAVAASFAAGGALAFPLSLGIERAFVSQSGIPLAREVNLVLFAPFVEELLKALCVLLFWKRFTEPADGVVYGAGVGFGFAAIENAGYALRTATEASGWSALVLAGNRVVTASVAHALLTALVGLTLALRRAKHTSRAWIPLAFAVAVLAHAGYNWFSLAVEQDLVSPWVGLPIGLAFWALVPVGAYGLRRLDGRTRDRRPQAVASPAYGRRSD